MRVQRKKDVVVLTSNLPPNHPSNAKTKSRKTKMKGDIKQQKSQPSFDHSNQIISLTSYLRLKTLALILQLLFLLLRSSSINSAPNLLIRLFGGLDEKRAGSSSSIGGGVGELRGVSNWRPRPVDLESGAELLRMGREEEWWGELLWWMMVSWYSGSKEAPWSGREIMLLAEDSMRRRGVGVERGGVGKVERLPWGLLEREEEGRIVSSGVR